MDDFFKPAVDFCENLIYTAQIIPIIIQIYKNKQKTSELTNLYLISSGSLCYFYWQNFYQKPLLGITIADFTKAIKNPKTLASLWPNIDNKQLAAVGLFLTISLIVYANYSRIKQNNKHQTRALEVFMECANKSANNRRSEDDKKQKLDQFFAYLSQNSIFFPYHSDVIAKYNETRQKDQLNQQPINSQSQASTVIKNKSGFTATTMDSRYLPQFGNSPLNK